MNNVDQLKHNYFVIPDADIYETENFYTLKMEIPGVKKDNLNIEINNGQLEVTGAIEDYTRDDLKYSEYDLYNYNRKFRVGKDIDVNNIEASLSNGVLTLTLNKAEEVKPKKIQISVN